MCRDSGESKNGNPAIDPSPPYLLNPKSPSPEIGDHPEIACRLGRLLKVLLCGAPSQEVRVALGTDPHFGSATSVHKRALKAALLGAPPQQPNEKNQLCLLGPVGIGAVVEWVCAPGGRRPGPITAPSTAPACKDSQYQRGCVHYKDRRHPEHEGIAPRSAINGVPAARTEMAKKHRVTAASEY